MTEFIPIEEFIAETQIDLGFSGEAMNSTIKGWTFRAIMQIGIPNCVIAKETIPIKDLAIQKPNDFVGLRKIHLITMTSGGFGLSQTDSESIKNGCVEPDYRACISCCDVPTSCCEEFKVSENYDTFYFSDNVTGFTHVYLEYYGAPLDKNGDPLVPYWAREAAAAFVEYMYKKRIRTKSMGKSTASRNNPVGVTDVRDALREWERLKNRSQASSIRLNSTKLKKLADRVMYDVSNAYPPRLSQCYSSFIKSCC